MLQIRWKDPSYLLIGGGGLTYAQEPHVTFSGRVQMYDGCCSVRRLLKSRQKIEGQLL